MRIRKKNVLVGAVVGLAIFVGCAWYAPLPLMLSIMEAPGTSLSESSAIVLPLLWSSFSDIPLPDMLYFAGMSVLIGANLTLTIEYLQRRRRDVRNISGIVGVFGSVAAILGFGCAACGSLLASWALGAFSAGWLLAVLPLGGEELRYVGVALLLISAFLTIRNLRNPSVCPVTP